MDQFTAYIKASGSMETMTLINTGGIDGGWIMILKMCTII